MKNTRKSHSRQNLRAGMWLDFRKELTGSGLHPRKQVPTLSSLSCSSACVSPLSSSPPSPDNFLGPLSPWEAPIQRVHVLVLATDKDKLTGLLLVLILNSQKG